MESGETHCAYCGAIVGDDEPAYVECCDGKVRESWALDHPRIGLPKRHWHLGCAAREGGAAA
jgi:uncharacterized Zn-finger protein